MLLRASANDQKPCVPKLIRGSSKRQLLVLLACVCFVTVELISDEPMVVQLVTRRMPRRGHAADDPGADEGLGLTATTTHQRHIYFLKTHKCASSTVQRIILMHALKHNLSVALPYPFDNIFFPEAYRPSLAKKTCSHPHFDVMASHALFSPSALGFMPNDTFFLSIVRDPADQMESAYHYFLVDGCGKYSLKNTTFEDYVFNLTLHRAAAADNASVSILYPCGIAELRFLQLYDMGLNVSQRLTKDVVAKHIEMLDGVFDLVLVHEELDEGLILMRDMLGWTMDDIAYIKSNFRASTTERLTNRTRQAAHAWNWADKMLYDHFKAKMDAMIGRQEWYVKAQVHQFRRLQSSYYEDCIAGIDRNASSHDKDIIGKVGAYVLSDKGKNDVWCRFAAMPENTLFRHLNLIQPLCNNTGFNGNNSSLQRSKIVKSFEAVTILRNPK